MYKYVNVLAADAYFLTVWRQYSLVRYNIWAKVKVR